MDETAHILNTTVGAINLPDYKSEVTIMWKRLGPLSRKVWTSNQFVPPMSVALPLSTHPPPSSALALKALTGHGYFLIGDEIHITSSLCSKRSHCAASTSPVPFSTAFTDHDYFPTQDNLHKEKGIIEEEGYTISINGSSDSDSAADSKLYAYSTQPWWQLFWVQLFAIAKEHAHSIWSDLPSCWEWFHFKPIAGQHAFSLWWTKSGWKSNFRWIKSVEDLSLLWSREYCSLCVDSRIKCTPFQFGAKKTWGLEFIVIKGILLVMSRFEDKVHTIPFWRKENVFFILEIWLRHKPGIFCLHGTSCQHSYQTRFDRSSHQWTDIWMRLLRYWT